MIAPGPMTLRQAFDSLLTDAPIAGSTRKLRAYQLDRWERMTDNPTLRDISTGTLIGFRTRMLAHGHSPETIETDLSTVMRILRAGLEAGWIPALPKRGKRLKAQPTKTPRITLSEFDQFLDGIATARLSLARRKKLSQGRITATRSIDFGLALWGSFYFSGLRLENVLQLRWQQFSSETLDVRQFKTGHLMAIPVHPVWKRLLSALPGAWTSGRIFVISRKTLYRDQRAIAAASGVQRVTPQAVRRLAARMYDRAHAGSGRLILGRPFPGADGNYLDAPEILQWASEKLQVPASLLTEEERQHDQLGESVLLTQFRELRGADRDAVLRFVSALRRPAG